MTDWKILLVDDEAEFVSTVAERLRLRNIDVQVATDGEEALACLEVRLPQVVVLDVMMPGMSGLEVLKNIKQNYPGVPVILLTGRGSTRDGVEGMRLGAADYMVKPVQIEELIKKMSEVIGSSIPSKPK